MSEPTHRPDEQQNPGTSSRHCDRQRSERNLDFYVGLLGLRFVKRTVNFDDPGTYHFYFGDQRGTPGAILTFFPWPGARRGIRGTGQVEATAFAVPPNSIGFWLDRLKQQHVTAEKTPTRFGKEVIRLIDPDGLLIKLIAVVAGVSPANIEPWPDSAVPAEHALHGFHSVSAALEGYERTARLLTESFCYRLIDESGNRFRLPRRTTRRRADRQPVVPAA